MNQRGSLRLVILLAAAAAGNAAAGETLLLNNGERLSGRLVSRPGDVIEFQSDRYGLLRLPASVATLAPDPETPQAPRPAPAPNPPAAPPPAPPKPWEGKLTVDLRLVDHNDDKRTIFLEGRVTRRWPADSLQATAKYEYEQTKVETTKDRLESTVEWKHELGHRWFTVAEGGYIRQVEKRLLTHTLDAVAGAGYHLLQRPRARWDVSLVAGRTEIRIPAAHLSASAHHPGLRSEGEIGLWHSLTLREEFEYYRLSLLGFTVDTWESKLSLIQPLSQHLSLTLRYDVRRMRAAQIDDSNNELRLLLDYGF